MPKRVSIKGRELEAFFGPGQTEPVDQQGSTTAQQPTGEEASPTPHALIKATFYLDQRSIDTLDELWLRLRKKGRKSPSKSELIRSAIRLLAHQ